MEEELKCMNLVSVIVVGDVGISKLRNLNIASILLSLACLLIFPMFIHSVRVEYLFGS